MALFVNWKGLMTLNELLTLLLLLVIKGAATGREPIDLRNSFMLGPPRRLNTVQEIENMTWAKYVDNDGLFTVPSEINAPGFVAGHPYDLGLGNPNFAYQACTTPTGTDGRCRYVPHCARAEIVASVHSLIKYACAIGDNYMGVCCPESTDTPKLTIVEPSTVSLSRVARVASNAPASAQQARKSCGELTKLETRIVGGQKVDKDEWPWMAVLMNEKSHFCGGVLITDRHVLTAAHCVVNNKPDEITVRLGEYDFTQHNTSGKEYKIEKIFIHENYTRRRETFHPNDIAVIKLKDQTSFNEAIWPICLPPPSVNLDGEDAYVIGFGKTASGEPLSDVLLEVMLPIWDLEDCREAIATVPILKTQLCAGYREGGKDSCQGDSGGPLMLQLASKRWAVVGIVSWGQGCALKNKPGVYTRVAEFSDWISNKVLS